MEDRFKVRVWDKDTNKFLDENDFFISSFGGLGFYSHEGRGEFNSDRYIKQQSTGLKDKSGKLIYEGDIVKFHLISFLRIGHVAWDEAFAQFGLKEIRDATEDKDYFHYLAQQRYEIIGNIYENPELLKTNE